MAIFNGNGLNGSGWRGFLSLLQTVALPVLGWALFMVVTLSNRVEKLEVTNENLWKWIQAEQERDDSWKKDEHAWDKETRDLIDRTNANILATLDKRDQNYNDALRRINGDIARLAQVLASKGLTMPP